MWSLKQKEDGSFILFFDRNRWYNPNVRGLWELIGQKGATYISHYTLVNEQRGYLCCDDTEGNVRVLVLE